LKQNARHAPAGESREKEEVYCYWSSTLASQQLECVVERVVERFTTVGMASASTGEVWGWGTYAPKSGA
jgi:hypothetical protein